VSLSVARNRVNTIYPTRNAVANRSPYQRILNGPMLKISGSTFQVITSKVMALKGFD
jgi:hypothetical protein